MKDLPVIEIFDSIEGEGKRIGKLSTFIRLAGCNVQCNYCDTKYALQGGKKKTFKEVFEKVREYGNVNVTITGGEPLIHDGLKDWVNELSRFGYKVNIETNGTVPLFNTDAMYTMDYKTKSSGVNDKMFMQNFNSLRKRDVLKIVCKEEDFPDIENVLANFSTKAQIILSPIYGEVHPEKLVEFAKKLRDIYGIDARVQVQLHKIIWGDKRGV